MHGWYRLNNTLIIFIVSCKSQFLWNLSHITSIHNLNRKFLSCCIHNDFLILTLVGLPGGLGDHRRILLRDQSALISKQNKSILS